jgi:hypothetical protein
MTKEETIMVLGYIKASYPRWAENLKSSDAKMMVEVWHDALADFDTELVLGAAKAHRNVEKWPPSIAEILEKVNFIKSKGISEMTGMEAWALVRKALKNGLYHAKEEFDKLPTKVQAAIGNYDSLKSWSEMNLGDLETVIQSQFIRSHGVKVEQGKRVDALPNDVKALVEQFSESRLIE